MQWRAFLRTVGAAHFAALYKTNGSALGVASAATFGKPNPCTVA